MNKQAVAQELVKVAKLLTADSGDVPVFLNIFDFFKTTDGEKLTAAQLEDAERYLENSAMSCTIDFEKAIRAAIVKRYKKQMEQGGLELK